MFHSNLCIRILLQHFQLFDILRLRSRKFLLAITQRYVCATQCERNSSFERCITASDNERVFARKFFRIIKPVVHFFQFFAGTSQLPVISAASDSDNYTPRACYGFSIPVAQNQLAVFSLNAFDARDGYFDTGCRTLHLHLFQQSFLNVRPELEPSFGRHICRVGIDRFCFWKINDRGKNLCCFENCEV